MEKKKKAKIIAFVNQKGGVAKTTTTLTTGKELARRGFSVLLVDLDPQASLSSVLGVERKKNEYTVQHFIGVIGEEAVPLEEVVEHLNDVDLLPSNILLGGYEQVMQSMDNNAKLFSRRIAKYSDKYDYILIDCPPSLGLLMKNGVMASDYIVVPVRPEVMSLMGFDLLVGTLIRLGESYDKEFDIAGILLTMCNKQTRSYKELRAFVDEKALELNTKVFDSSIRNSVQCSNLIGGGENVIEKISGSPVAQDYKAFVDELIQTIGG